jgi:hypothetical protein
MITRAEFIRRAQEIHGDRFDYSGVVDLPRVTMCANIRCRIHGEFGQIAYNHLKGYGCSKCKGSLISRTKRMSPVDFVARAKKIHGNAYQYPALVGLNRMPHKMVDIVCPTHGAFAQWKQNHLAGNGCPHCANENRKKGYHCDSWHGRSVRYQGYELIAADYLIEEKGISPDEIVFSKDGGVPVIRYTLKSRGHVHYPDLWIPHLNLIVEVKSTYTYLADRAKNLNKLTAARKAGFRYVLLVMDADGNRVYSADAPELQVNRAGGFTRTPAKVHVL